MLSETFVMPLRIRFKKNLQAEIARVAHRLVRRSIEEIEAETDEMAEIVHSIRKRFKKMRGLLQLVRAAIPEAYDLENRWYRDQARTASEARNAVVLLDLFNAIRTELRTELTSAQLQNLEKVFEPLMRPKLSKDLQRDLLKKISQGLNEADLRIDSWRIDGNVETLKSGFLRMYRKARSSMQTASHEHTTKTLHQWRKMVKYHMYQCELLERMSPPRMKQRRHSAKQLATLLGDDHDLAVLGERFSVSTAEKLESSVRQTLNNAIRRHRTTIQKHAFELGNSLFFQSAADISKRLFERNNSD